MKPDITNVIKTLPFVLELKGGLNFTSIITLINRSTRYLNVHGNTTPCVMLTTEVMDVLDGITVNGVNIIECTCANNYSKGVIGLAYCSDGCNEGSTLLLKINK